MKKGRDPNSHVFPRLRRGNTAEYVYRASTDFGTRLNLLLNFIPFCIKECVLRWNGRNIECIWDFRNIFFSNSTILKSYMNCCHFRVINKKSVALMPIYNRHIITSICHWFICMDKSIICSIALYFNFHRQIAMCLILITRNIPSYRTIILSAHSSILHFNGISIRKRNLLFCFFH